jgi:hypothetical protein
MRRGTPRPSETGDRLVVIATYGRQIDADLARAELEAAGIPAAVLGSELPLHGFPGVDLRLAVPEAHAARARELIGASSQG